MTKRSAGLLMFKGRGLELRLPTVRSGRRRTTALGRSRRANMTRARIRSPWRVANSKRSFGARRRHHRARRTRFASRKRITAFALEGRLRSRCAQVEQLELEWPPQSGRMQSFPEVDRAVWFTPDEARRRSCPASVPSSIRLLERLATRALERNCRHMHPFLGLRCPRLTCSIRAKDRGVSAQSMPTPSTRGYVPPHAV